MFSAVSNVLGWPTSSTDPQSHTSTAGYDRNGLLRRAVNRASEVATFNYDSLGRPTLRAAGGDTTTYAYDGSTSPVDPHWAVAANAESRDSVTTDANGNVTSVVNTRGALTLTSTMTYDAVGNRKVLRVTNGTWTDSLVFENDSIQFPWELPDFGGNWTRIRYNADQLVDTLRYPTGGSTTRLQVHPSSYTHFLRPGDVDVYVGSSHVQHWWFTYDNVGRLTFADSGSDKDYVQRHLTYDARDRLASYLDEHVHADSVQESCPDDEITCDPPPPWDYTWYDDTLRMATYNPDYSGNRTDGSASLSNDRLSSMTGADGRAYSFTYDNEGRLTAKTATGYSQTYGWNALGELIWVKTNSDSVAFGYDAEGRRVRKYDAGTTTRYVWDGAQLAMQLDSSGNRTFEYSYQPGLDAPVAVKSGSTMYYYQMDETGSVAAVWNTSNSTVATYTYDPYGYTVASGGSLAQPLRWKGAQYDAETGLYYMRARYYDPTVGRFISEDPAGLSGGIDPYAFANGEPVNASDPTGLCSYDEFLIALVAYEKTGTPLEQNCTPQLLGAVVSTASRDPADFLDPWSDHPRPAAEPGLRAAVPVGGPSGGPSQPTPVANHWQRVKACIVSHFHLDDLRSSFTTVADAIRTLSYIGATPIGKKLLGVPRFAGGSEYTNPISALRLVFGDVDIPVRVLGTKSAFGVLGRANILLAVGMASYDVTSIGLCTFTNDPDYAP